MMLEVRDLSVSYGRHLALSEIEVHVGPGEIVVILGANGAGKSSLLQAIAGMSEGTVGGSVSLDGAPLLGLSADEIVERGIAYVPEGRGIFGDLTVWENLLLGAYSDRARGRQDENLQAVLSLFPKLAERRRQIARTMSGGEQQMVAIGRAMMSDPEILMLDEPSLGLSPLLCKELFHNLSEIRSTGLGVLLVEQNAKQSLAIADRGYLLENGGIIGENEAQAMLNDPAVQAAYLGGAAATADQTVATPTEKVAAPTVKQPAPTVEQPAPTYVQPRQDTGPTRSADNLAGQAISGLVQRATDRAKTVAPAPPEVRQPPPASRVAPDTTVGQDADIARVVNEIEEAARRARSASPASTPRHPKPTAETEEPLPEIPVWRRRSVEVWKRGPDGKLKKEQ